MHSLDKFTTYSYVPYSLNLHLHIIHKFLFTDKSSSICDAFFKLTIIDLTSLNRFRKEIEIEMI